LPDPHKDFQWSRLWNDVWPKAKQAVGEADALVILGYSMSPADEWARDLLFNVPELATITICNMEGSEALAKEFRKKRRLGAEACRPDLKFEDWVYRVPDP
jgi:hypothetical protein